MRLGQLHFQHFSAHLLKIITKLHMRIRSSTDYRALHVVCSVSFFVPCFIMSLNVLISFATKKQRALVFVILLNRTLINLQDMNENVFLK